MRIQHNIMAINAYRNYTTNTSAMQKNLERLSSGYKINRAGDDAAGLAISEKMRAQITGLEVAQKNAKDGISLVQTAEGALTEVHDMLNRMVELATQSANGTYSNDTDRVQLQKELDQLRDEIDRIADSANFNGIQLLDGNMDAGGDTVYTKGAFQIDDKTLHPAGLASGAVKLPPTGSVLGTDTVLHTEGTKGGDTNAFSIDLHNVSLLAGKSIDIAIGDNITITVKNSGDDPMDAEAIVAAIQSGSADVSAVDGKGNDVAISTDGKLTIGKTDFQLSSSGTRLTFTQTSKDDGITMPKTVTITGTPSKMNLQGPTNETGTIVDGDDDAAAGGSGAKAAVVTIDLAGITAEDVGTIVVSIGGKEYEVEITQEMLDDVEENGTDLGAHVAKALSELIKDGDFSSEAGGAFTVGYDDNDPTKITLTATEKVATGLTDDDFAVTVTDPNAAKYVADTENATTGSTGEVTITGVSNDVRLDDDTQSNSPQPTDVTDGTVISVSIGTETFEVTLKNDTSETPEGTKGVDWIDLTAISGFSGATLATAIKEALLAQIENYNSTQAEENANADYNKIEVTADDIVFGNTGTANTITVNYSIVPQKYTLPGGDSFSGDYNASTTVLETKSNGTQDRLASTVFSLEDLTGDDGTISEGTTITIGRDTYTFTYDKNKIGKDGYVVLNGGENPDNLTTIAEKLTAAAKGNTTYTVGHDGTNITITEIEDQTNFDLSTMAGIEKSLGFKIATTRPTDNSKGLTLQIGDTAESYNQLKVNIKDCHVKALGIDQISIANQTDAGEAVDLINDAINYVSDVRGTLGATQNRLDHTINNLSVMTENIQDAESTIRDTDIAEEMMSYTKNNILIQAAQAMLAQANQVPQGVLQLLQ